MPTSSAYWAIAAALRGVSVSVIEAVILAQNRAILNSKSEDETRMHPKIQSFFKHRTRLLIASGT
jgi:hypothetical protein